MVSNCDRGAVEKTLSELAERDGIEIHEMEPAYPGLRPFCASIAPLERSLAPQDRLEPSKTCSGCGYVDARQRTGETFHCQSSLERH